MSLLTSIKLRLSDLYSICINEFRSIFSDSGAILFFLVVPFVYPFLYSALYGNEGIREAPLVVVDYNQSSLSREFIRRVDASPDVRIIAQPSNESEAYQAIAQEQAYGILIIPKDFNKNLAQGIQATIDLHTTFAATLYYKAYSLATTEVALSMGREIERARNYGASAEASRIAVRPIDSEWIAPYNPQSGFQGFLLPGVLVLIIQQTLLLGISMVAGTQREKGSLVGPRLQIGGHQASIMRMLLGKSLCYFITYTASSLFVLVIAPSIFGLPQLTNITSYFALLVPMLLAMIFFAFFWSLITRHREQSMILWVFTSVPFLFLSGLSWPWSAIPAPLKALAYLLPSTPGIQAFISINSMGAQIHEVLPQYTALWIQALVYFLLASLTYAYMLRRQEKQ